MDLSPRPQPIPHRIELITKDDRVLRGVYKIDNDTLTVCLPFNDDTKRAEGFDAPANSGLIRLELKSKAAPPTPQPTSKTAVVTPAAPRRATDREIRRQHELHRRLDDPLDPQQRRGLQRRLDPAENRREQPAAHQLAGHLLHEPADPGQAVVQLSVTRPVAISEHDRRVTNKFDDLLHGIYRFDGDTRRSA